MQSFRLDIGLAFFVSLMVIADIDGAYFGTTFPHLFLMAYGNLKPQKPTQSYVPKIFGFKVHNKQWYALSPLTSRMS